MTTPREIEKLRALGCQVVRSASRHPDSQFRAKAPGKAWFFVATEEDAWQLCKSWAQSPDGLVASMAAKVRWLCQAWPEDGLVTKNLEPWHIALVQEEGTDMALTRFDGAGPSPEAAVDALFWSVQ